MKEIRFFSGYVWYARPVVSKDKFGLMFVEGKMLPVKAFDETKMFPNYNADGIIIVTDSPKKPVVSKNWEIVPYNFPDGMSGKVDNEIVRHIANLEESSEKVHSVFAGLKV